MSRNLTALLLGCMLMSATASAARPGQSPNRRPSRSPREFGGFGSAIPSRSPRCIFVQGLSASMLSAGFRRFKPLQST